MSLGGNGVTGIVWGMWTFIVAWIRVAGFLIAGGVGGDMDGAGGGMGVLRIQLVNSSWSLEIVINCSWWLEAGTSFIEHEIKLRAWMILSSAENIGWVS